MTQRIKIKGLVEIVTYHNEDNGFSVLKCKLYDYDFNNHYKKKSEDNLVTVTAVIANINIGEEIEAEGFWIKDINYGFQFKAEFIVSHRPTDKEAMEKYLSSKAIKGVGKIYAKKIISKFKEQSFDIIENDINQLKKIKGIGQKRIKLIKNSFEQYKDLKELMIFLTPYKINSLQLSRIYKKFGKDSIGLIKENPYIIASEIKGIGFKTADKIGLSINKDPYSDYRIKAAINFRLLKRSSDEGSYGEEFDSLSTKIAEILKENLDQFEEINYLEDSVFIDKIKNIILNLVNNDELILFEENIKNKQIITIYLKSFYFKEKDIAEKLSSIKNAKKKEMPMILIKSEIDNFQKKYNISFSDNQKEAILSAFTNKLLVITGGPGTGKTTITNMISYIFKKLKFTILLLSPTGKAAKRLAEATKMEAQTIHRAIINKKEPLNYDVIIIDEASMVDINLFNNLLKLTKEKTYLILVGDKDQLPSVGTGQILKDIIDSKKIKIQKLESIFRQKNNSKIIEASYNINKQIIPNIANSAKDDLFFFPRDNDQEIINTLFDLILNRLEKKFNLNFFRDIQILTSIRKGILGSNNLNNLLQEKLNINSDKESKFIIRYGQKYAIGDKIIQMENNYDKEIFNGESGIIVAINKEFEEILIKFESKEDDIIYSFDELDQIDLSYAMTIHKSQGSEYPCVIIITSMKFFTLLNKNLLYTAITRGKKLVILIGEKRAFIYAIKNKKDLTRITKLKDLL